MQFVEGGMEKAARGIGYIRGILEAQA